MKVDFPPALPAGYLRLLPLLLLGSTAFAQFSTFTPVDQCGGQSAFLGPNYIIEESSGFCGNSAIPITGITISNSPNTVTVTLSAVGGLSSAIQISDLLYITGATAPSCLNNVSGFSVSSIGSGSIVMTPRSFTCAGTVSAPYGSLNGAYHKNTVGLSSDRYELKLIAQNSGGWPSAPTISLLSTASMRTSLGLSAPDCSIGNPGGFYDGSHYYIAFIAQHTSRCSGSAYSKITPGQGGFYDLWACNLTGLMPTPTLTAGSTGNCNTIEIANTLGDPYSNNSFFASAMLDPHIWHGNVFVSERDNNTVYTDLITSSSVSYYDVWSVDNISVNWGTPGTTPPSTTSIGYYVFGNGTWLSNTSRDSSGNSRATAHCEEYYKLTGIAGVPNPASSSTSFTRAFFQSNDINGSGASPFVGVYGTSPGSCDNMGAGGVSDAFVFSGLFYADLGTTQARTGTTTLAGDHYTQLYPPNPLPSGISCLTPGKSVDCYGEFPWIFQDLTKIMFTGNIPTVTSAIDECVLHVTNCKENYTDEQSQGILSTDYTQASVPMALVSARAFTNYNVIGTAACNQILPPYMGTGNCGLYGTHPRFGGCGHLDIDEANQILTCGAATSVLDVWGNVERQTMVVPLSVSLLNPAVQVQGGAVVTNGIGIASH